MGQQVKLGWGNPLGAKGIKPDMQTGTPPANAIRAIRMESLQPQAVCKTASPLKLHAAESCFPGDVHVRPSLVYQSMQGGDSR